MLMFFLQAVKGVQMQSPVLFNPSCSACQISIYGTVGILLSTVAA